MYVPAGFWRLTKFDNGKNHFEFETPAPLEKSVFTNISKYKSINKGLSKAHKTATSSIQEYLHPNHGHHIYGDEDETEKKFELAGLTRVFRC